MELKDVVAKRVREMRTVLGLTLADLSKRTGLKEQYLHRVEKGEHQVTLRNLQVLADGLGISAATLIDEPSTLGEKEARLAKLEMILKVVKKAVEDV